uniref:DNA primase large subunit n=1 Tax=Zea mays TaxID=4577 RepID=A0A804RKG6_MAIZE
MEIVRSHRQVAAAAAGGGAGALPTYKAAPQLEVRLEEFELFAIDRLRVLKGISDGLSRGKRPEEVEKLVNELWKTHMGHQDPAETLNKDIISHFVLRLVYCRTEELRKWFLSMETTLFRYRFRLENPESQRMLMTEFQLPYKALPHSEFEAVKDKLSQVARSIGQSANVDHVFFKVWTLVLAIYPFSIYIFCSVQKLIPSKSYCNPIKVPFEQVPDLVASRRVFLSKGYAYVAMNQVVSLVVTQFRCNISKALALTNRKWSATIKEQEKDRLTPIVEALSNAYFGPDYSQPKDAVDISLKDIDQLAKSSFPLCMRHMLDKLRENHHLKHGGRLQFGLFLKGAGLKLEDALAFWRAEFSQKIGSERFDKEYAYSIRHNYGKEGKRTDYTPYSCQNIISATPGVGDHHGCPFRHFGEENLRAALNKMGVGGHALEEIIDKVKNRHYQLACTLTFETTHGVSCDSGINHPNQYFSESQKVLRAKNQKMESQSAT